MSCLWMPTTPPAVSCQRTKGPLSSPQQTTSSCQATVFPWNLPLANFSGLGRTSTSIHSWWERKPRYHQASNPPSPFLGHQPPHSSLVRGLRTLFSADWCRFTQLNTLNSAVPWKQGQSWPKLLLTYDLLLTGSWEHASPVCHLPLAALL